jgi:hypothetical protein
VAVGAPLKVKEISVSNPPNPVSVHGSDRVFQLSDFVIQYQLDTVKSTGSSADPILVLQYGEERKIYRIIGPDLETAAQEILTKSISQGQPADAYALAYDARLPYSGEKFDAIVAEVADVEDKMAKRFAQRYRQKKGFFSKFELVGSPMYLGTTKERHF